MRGWNSRREADSREESELEGDEQAEEEAGIGLPAKINHDQMTKRPSRREGLVRWVEVRDWLNAASENGRKRVRQIVFEGERFDVMSVRRKRPA